jgi:adenosylcobinamide-phosphate guanylyltransferase
MDVEKPLLEIGGRPMVDRILNALDGSRIERVCTVVSPHAPATRAHLAALDDGPQLIETPGEGYVADLDAALERVGRPVLTVAADLPLLSAAAVGGILDASAVPDADATLDAGGGSDDGPDAPVRSVRSLAVSVPAALKRSLGASVDAPVERDGRELVAAGINVVAVGDDVTHVSHDPRFAVNVNRPRDVRVAEALL